MKKLTLKELEIYMDQARRDLMVIQSDHLLVGMTKSISEGQTRALAFLRASLLTWNARGLLAPDWESKVDLEPLLADSSPDTE